MTWEYVSYISKVSKTIELIPPGCCGLCCNPCITYQTAEDLGKSGVLYLLLGCIAPCIPALLLRQEARSRYNIEVSISWGARNHAISISCYSGRYRGRRRYSFLLHCLRDLPNCCRDQGEGGQLQVGYQGRTSPQNIVQRYNKIAVFIFTK